MNPAWSVMNDEVMIPNFIFIILCSIRRILGIQHYPFRRAVMRFFLSIISVFSIKIRNIHRKVDGSFTTVGIEEKVD